MARPYHLLAAILGLCKLMLKNNDSFGFSYYLGVIKILITEMYNGISRFLKSTLSCFQVMAQGCIDSIRCYADWGKNESVAMTMGVKIAALVAHIYFSIFCITVITLQV